MVNAYKINEYKDIRPPMPRNSMNTTRVHFRGGTLDPYESSKRASNGQMGSHSPQAGQRLHSQNDDDINSNDSLISKDSPQNSSPRGKRGGGNMNQANNRNVMLNFENLASNKMNVEKQSQFTSIHLNENSISGYDERQNTSIDDFDD